MKYFSVLALIFTLLTALLSANQITISSLDHSAPVEKSETQPLVEEDIHFPVSSFDPPTFDLLIVVLYPPHITLLPQEQYHEFLKPPSLT